MAVKGNLEAIEGTLNGQEVITFALRPRQLIITNDSGANDLQFKFRSSAEYATLRPTETVNLENTMPTHLFLSTTGAADYRIWAFG